MPKVLLIKQRFDGYVDRHVDVVYSDEQPIFDLVAFTHKYDSIVVDDRLQQCLLRLMFFKGLYILSNGRVLNLYEYSAQTVTPGLLSYNQLRIYLYAKLFGAVYCPIWKPVNDQLISTARAYDDAIVQKYVDANIYIIPFKAITTAMPMYVTSRKNCIQMAKTIEQHFSHASFVEFDSRLLVHTMQPADFKYLIQYFAGTCHHTDGNWLLQL